MEMNVGVTMNYQVDRCIHQMIVTEHVPVTHQKSVATGGE